MLSLRRALPSPPNAARCFHSTARRFVKAGDTIPDVPLMENSPGNTVSLAKELSGNGIIIGVPAAFSPSCSESHIPGYINSPKIKNAGAVFVVSVNDAFVMKAWKASLDPDSKSGIRFLADPSAAFAKSLDLTFDAPQIFGGPRSKRYALLIKDGKVAEAHIEPDNTGLNISAAEKVLQ
ncbi:Redoxin [Pseudovirgaria hyperparasitica]|uniref:Redoxin n=1 Tax=Pseudovirgaria hyperparasitica TaxID=470096 RepID=A0A6A6WDM3_9PEZI|nr:Redoxin [Pseudovirgaria hyperparasitica]KAF2760154.1 Redoxin [Pseudovirgaria hyperparasitica]